MSKPLEKDADADLPDSGYAAVEDLFNQSLNPVAWLGQDPRAARDSRAISLRSRCQRALDSLEKL